MRTTSGSFRCLLQMSQLPVAADVTIATSIEYESPSDVVAGSFSILFDGKSSEQIPHNASETSVKSAIEGIDGIPAGLVSVSRSVANFNFLHNYTVRFITRRGNIDALQFDTAQISSLKGLSARESEAPITYPFVTLMRLRAGTRVGGKIGISYKGSAVQYANAYPLAIPLPIPDDPSTTGTAEGSIEAALSSIPALAGGNISVEAFGPDADGGFLWEVSITGLGTLADFEVVDDELNCGVGPVGEIERDRCNPGVHVTKVRNGSLQEVQVLSITSSHAKEIQELII